MKKILLPAITSLLFSFCASAAEEPIKQIAQTDEEKIFLLRMTSTLMQDVPAEFRNNKEFVLKMVKQNGLELNYATNDLKNNKEILIAAIKQNPVAIIYSFGNDFKNSKEIARIAVKKCGILYEHTPATDGMLIRVKLVAPLQYFTREVQLDKKIALEAVKNCRENYAHLLPEHKINKEILSAYLGENYTDSKWPW